MRSALRLRRSSDFADVRLHGRFYKHRVLMMNIAENNLPHNRYGFVTSKKVGNAVVRNRTKRRLREATYQLHPHLRQGYDIVVIARPSIVGQPFSQLLRILDDLCRRAKLIK
ncbi:MAG: ribonuclease P protein component, partial [Phototrophicales bacterium]